ncbi:MAG: response regulator transcription factor [Bacteroidota bacterium]
MKSNKKILLVEDDPNFGRILKDYLTINNYEVLLAVNGIEGFEKFNKSEFDLCILDIMMPFKDGLTLAKEIREINETVPLIFLTAKNLKDDVLKGYRIGADDYLTKPFDSEILLAKIKTILNRKPSVNIQEKDEFEFNFSEFNFNSKLRILTHKEGDSFKLSPKENQLLKMLVSNFDDLLPRDIALNKIWRDANYFTSRSMDVYIAKLRKYLEKDPSLKIINVHGEGFRLTKD